MMSKNVSQNLQHSSFSRGFESETSRPTVIPSDRLVFLGGLPLNATREEVQEYLEQFGPLDKLILPKDVSTKKIKGYGKALFIDRAGALRALATSCHEIRGMKFGVSPWIDPTCYNQIKTEMAQRKVYVKHRPQHSKEALLAYFEQFGHVEAIDMRLSFSSNKSRNFCYVLFESDDVAHQVVTRRCHNLLGMPLVCQMCIPQTKPEGSTALSSAPVPKSSAEAKQVKKAEQKAEKALQKQQNQSKLQKAKALKQEVYSFDDESHIDMIHEQLSYFQESPQADFYFGENYGAQVYIPSTPHQIGSNYPPVFEMTNPVPVHHPSGLFSEANTPVWSFQQQLGCQTDADFSLHLTKQGYNHQDAVSTAFPSPQETPECRPLSRALQQIPLAMSTVSEQHFTSSFEKLVDSSRSSKAHKRSEEFPKSRDGQSQTLPDLSFSREEEFLDSLIKPTSAKYSSSRVQVIEARHLVLSNLIFRARDGGSRPFRF